MSLCDHCFSPGACCKSLTLSGGPWGEDRKAMEGGRPTYTDALNFARKNDLPFVPLLAQETEPGRWIWRYSCPKLSPEGRCTIYADRPELCRIFEAGQDDLCVHSRGFTAGDASALVTLAPKHRRWPFDADTVIDNEAPW